MWFLPLGRGNGELLEAKGIEVLLAWREVLGIVSATDSAVAFCHARALPALLSSPLSFACEGLPPLCVSALPAVAFASPRDRVGRESSAKRRGRSLRHH